MELNSQISFNSSNKNLQDLEKLPLINQNPQKTSPGKLNTDFKLMHSRDPSRDKLTERISKANLIVNTEYLKELVHDKVVHQYQNRKASHLSLLNRESPHLSLLNRESSHLSLLNRESLPFLKTTSFSAAHKKIKSQNSSKFLYVPSFNKTKNFVGIENISKSLPIYEAKVTLNLPKNNNNHSRYPSLRNLLDLELISNMSTRVEISQPPYIQVFSAKITPNSNRNLSPDTDLENEDSKVNENLNITKKKSNSKQSCHEKCKKSVSPEKKEQNRFEIEVISSFKKVEIKTKKVLKLEYDESIDENTQNKILNTKLITKSSQNLNTNIDYGENPLWNPPNYKSIVFDPSNTKLAAKMTPEKIKWSNLFRKLAYVLLFIKKLGMNVNEVK